MVQGKWLTVGDCAKLCKVSDRWVRRLIKSKGVKSERDERGRLLVLQADAERYADIRKENARQREAWRHARVSLSAYGVFVYERLRYAGTARKERRRLRGGGEPAWAAGETVYWRWRGKGRLSMIWIGRVPDLDEAKEYRVTGKSYPTGLTEWKIVDSIVDLETGEAWEP